MKWLNMTLVVIFIIFAGLQYNDPDPYIWVPIYLLAAFICWRGAKEKYHPVLSLIGISAYAIYAAYLFFDKNGVLSWANEHAAENIVQTMKAEKPWIEETREFGGLLIAMGAVAMNYIRGRKG